MALEFNNRRLFESFRRKKLSTFVFSMANISKNVTEEIKIEEKHVVFPIVENNNHFILVLVPINQRKFILLDPMG